MLNTEIQHLYIKYSESFENNGTIDTMEEHIRIDEDLGQVIWGQFTTAKQDRFDPARIKRLDEQRKQGIATYVFFYSGKGGNTKLYVAEYVCQYGRKDIKTEDYKFIPRYYHDRVNHDYEEGKLTCKAYIRIKNIRELPLESLSDIHLAINMSKSLKQELELSKSRPKTLLYVLLTKEIYEDLHSFGEDYLIYDGETFGAVIEENCVGNPIDIWEIVPNDVFDLPPERSIKTNNIRGGQRKGVKTDYEKKARNNKNLGLRGELFVVKVEKSKLIKAGRKDLADKVEHTSEKLGDGLGYDIKSFEVDEEGNDREIFIEVKTTTRNKKFFFLATRTEVEVSVEKGDQYYIYRVFDFDLKNDSGKIYLKKGSIMENFDCQAEQYSIIP